MDEAKIKQVKDELLKLVKQSGVTKAEANTEKMDVLIRAAGDWLTKDLDAEFRSVQILHLNTSIPGVHQRKCLESVWNRIQVDWEEVGLEAADVLPLQLVLSALVRCNVENLTYSDVASVLFHHGPYCGLDGKSIQVVGWMRAHYSGAGDLGIPPADEDQPGFAAVETQSNFLWWGQAKYSHQSRVSFRTYKDKDEQLWRVASEAADWGHLLAVAPSSAWVQEILLSLGQDLDETKTLWQWIELTYPVIQKVKGEVQEPLNALATEDCLLLPVTYLRLDLARKLDRTTMAKEVGVDLDGKLDRGEWAAWIYREMVLEARMTRGMS